MIKKEITDLDLVSKIESIEKGRQIIAKTEKVKVFEEPHTPDWDDAYKRFCNIIKNNKGEK